MTVASRMQGAVLGVFLLISPSAVLAQIGVSTTPPEVQKTVDAFLGHWTLTGTATEPGATVPSRVTGTLDCEPAASGAAVRCRVINSVTGGG